MTPSGYARIAGFWSHPLDNGFSTLDTFMDPHWLLMLAVSAAHSLT